MNKYIADLFSQQKYKLAESPFYDARYSRLSWVDIIEGKLFIIDEEGITSETSFGQMVGAAVPMMNDNGYMVAATDGLYTFMDGMTKKVYNLTNELESYQRCNDAKMDPEGRLWFGTIVYDGSVKQHGNLYSYSNGTVLCKQKDTKLANGMAWNKASNKFYFSDSGEHKVFIYDYDVDTGNISNRKVLYTVTDGVPDGMCIDRDDNIWLAVWGGSRIDHIDGRTGEKLSEISVPAVQVSSCCFYNSNKLFITTAGDGLSGEYDGCLFTCDVNS